MDRAAFGKAAKELGLELGDEQLDLFQAFEENLYRANEVMNLTRIPKEECWLRHFLDSLLLQDLIPKEAAVLDIGSGPGFPSWPLACARPDIKVTALDSSGKMLGFLGENPLPNLDIVQGRAEEWGIRERFDFVTGRALAPLPIQLELSAAPCKVHGLVVPMRTPNDAISDALELGISLKEVTQRPLPGTDVVRVFPVYEKVKRTLPKYPRNWAEIRRKPIAY